MNERKTQVLLAMQLALLGEISSKIRAVTVIFKTSSIHFECFCDGEIEAIDEASMLCVDTELVAIFPENQKVTHAVKRLDSPTPIPRDANTHFVFLRRDR
jgi:hypothetical protein